jgi:hypothetical protein
MVLPIFLYLARRFVLSKITDKFEQDIVEIINGIPFEWQGIPRDIPQWMKNIGIKPGARIIDANRVGSSGSKTDVIMYLEDSEPIKISAKLTSADYFGNWYSHKRIIEEFGEDKFKLLVTDCTEWANWWKHKTNASLFVGVPINFGRRTGNTAQEFTKFFDFNDIVKIVAGYGTGDEVANCLYQSSNAPKNFGELFENLKPIDEETIFRLGSNFKIAYRPINPLTEGTNRYKAIYTQFKPYQRLSQPTTITDLSELNRFGEYVEVESNGLNTNILLNQLEKDFNIIIPRKKR